jgi:SAM-dependent methyltransferase
MQMAETDPTEGSTEWGTWRQRVDLDEYEQRWKKLAESGENPHGEADLVCAFAPGSVLDAGCGMGRVAIELTNRGIATVGVDLDPDLLGRARELAPALEWHLGDLATFDLERTFDVVVAAGNVIGFVAADDREAAVRGCAAHVGPGGRLIVGYSLNRRWPSLELYDEWCAASGLVLEHRYATWEGEPFEGSSGAYHVSVHQRPGS